MTTAPKPCYNFYTMILTPQQLWKDYDRKAVPLAVSTVHEGESADYFSRSVYFNGERAQDGVIRIFAILYTPKCPLGNSAVIVFDDITNAADAFNPALYLKNGFSVLVVDYAGRTEITSRFTLYPKSFATAEYFVNPAVLSDFETSPKESCRYIWATVALRAITFLESEGYADLFMLGIGEGGEQVWKTCYFENTVRAGAVVFSGGAQIPAGGGEQNKNALAYKAALDASAYAKFIKSPVFIQVTSNEQNGSLDRMSELYEAAYARGAYLSVSERAGRSIAPERADYVAQWFSSVLRGERLPPPPSLSAKGSQNKLYYEITVPSSHVKLSKISLFVAHAQTNSAFRNWRIEPVQMISENEYLAKVAVLSVREPVYAFVNAAYENGLTLSSAVVEVLPSALGITAEALTFKRLIYESDMGLSDWLILNDAGHPGQKLSLQKGPFDLMGVSASSNALTTFRLADPQFKGRADSVLQITLFAPAETQVAFTITAADLKNEYLCQKELSGDNTWAKFTLSPSDFKGAKGALSGWHDVLTLEIKSAGTVLVNSLLWV